MYIFLYLFLFILKAKNFNEEYMKNLPNDINPEQIYTEYKIINKKLDDYKIHKKDVSEFDYEIVRKELRDCSPEEIQEYKQAVLRVRENGIIDDLSRLHTECEKYAHNSIRFLPWHRAFLLYFENILKVVNNKKITIPYWDWAIDAESPESSYAIKEVWPLNDSDKCFLVNFPNQHCVKRAEHFDYFYDVEQLKRIIKLPFSKFANYFELVPHAIVHMKIGGTDGDMAMLYSCNDPIFFHHHSFCDYIWQIEQEQSENIYSGDPDEILFPFGIKVKDVWKSNVYYKPYRINYRTGKKIKKRNKNKKSRKNEEIAEYFIERHGYDVKNVRKIERYLTNNMRFLERLWN